MSASLGALNSNILPSVGNNSVPVFSYPIRYEFLEHAEQT